MPVKQVNILHSNLNPFFAVYQNANLFFPPKSHNLSRTSLEIGTPKWNGKPVVARMINVSPEVQRQQMSSEHLVTSALKLPEEKKN